MTDVGERAREIVGRLTEAQLSAFNSIRWWSDDGRYMPYQSNQRTFDALERKGVVEYSHTGEPGIRRNGYALTELGLAVRALLEQRNED